MNFRSGKQRKAVMTRLVLAARKVKQEGFKVSKVDITDKFFRFRQEDPKKFDRLRTIDPGRPGKMKLIIGFKDNKSKVQSVLIER